MRLAYLTIEKSIACLSPRPLRTSCYLDFLSYLWSLGALALIFLRVASKVLAV